MQLPGFELPEALQARQRAYDNQSARVLEEMADRIENGTPQPAEDIQRSHELLNGAIQAIGNAQSPELPASRVQSFVAILRALDALTTSLASEINGAGW
jgi:hypothetical protein